MIKLLRLLGFGKNIKKAVKLNRTAAFADYGTALKTISSKENLSQLTYNPKAPIPATYTTPEFKSYLSQTLLKREKARKIKMKKLKAELKRQEEKAKEELFHRHEKIVSQLIYIDPKYLSGTYVSKEIKNLTDPDICLELLDYNGFMLTNENKQKFMSNTNNILLRKIAKGGKSIRRTEVLIERFKKEAAKTTCSYPHEVKELVNAILHNGEPAQLQSFFKILKKCAESKSISIDLNRNVLLGIVNAAKNITVPKEYSEIGKIIIQNPNRTWLSDDAALALSYFKGKFDFIAEFMTRNQDWAKDIRRSEKVVTAGFRSALKDGKLDEFKEIVFNPEHKYFPYLIDDAFKFRTPEEDALFKKEITSRLFNKEFFSLLELYHKEKLYRVFGKEIK